MHVKKRPTCSCPGGLVQLHCSRPGPGWNVLAWSLPQPCMQPVDCHAWFIRLKHEVCIPIHGRFNLVNMFRMLCACGGSCWPNKQKRFFYSAIRVDAWRVASLHPWPIRRVRTGFLAGQSICRSRSAGLSDGCWPAPGFHELLVFFDIWCNNHKTT